MHKTTKVIVGVALGVILGAIGFIGGFAVARLDKFSESPAAVSLGISKNDLSSKVAEVDQMLKDKALSPPSETSATAGAIQGLLASNGDKYASYFNVKQFTAFGEQTMGSFGGIGVVLGENKQGQANVVEVYKDTPAAKAGVKAGDVFHSIDGTTQAKWTTEEVVRFVRGPEGTQVRLTMTRPAKDPSKPGTELTFTIVRAVIDLPNTKTQMFGNVGYVRLGQFNANSAKDITKAVTELTGKGAKALILDLRDNPGGLLDQAVDVSSLFIKDGVIVRVDERNKPEQISYANGNKITDLPLVVLIDAQAASASEIAGGALQDYGRATLVGEKSYGKGSVQTIVKLSDGSGLKFTIAHYLTPKKRAINGIGLTPDVVVTMDPMKQMDQKTDTQLIKAVAIAKSKAK
jgi:carboxyl-terminal processing protease